jgi:hypothetical protein
MLRNDGLILCEKCKRSHLVVRFETLIEAFTFRCVACGYRMSEWKALIQPIKIKGRKRA